MLRGSFFLKSAFILSIIIGFFTAPAGLTKVSPRKISHVSEGMEIAYNSDAWLYYEPDFLKTAGVGVFESSEFNSLHGYLRTEVSPQVDYTPASAQLRTLCNELAELPLDAESAGGKAEIVTLGSNQFCRVKKEDKAQIAVQWVFLSSAKRKNSDPIHFTHYLYFYYPKSGIPNAENLITDLVGGIQKAQR